MENSMQENISAQDRTVPIERADALTLRDLNLLIAWWRIKIILQDIFTAGDKTTTLKLNLVDNDDTN